MTASRAAVMELMKPQLHVFHKIPYNLPSLLSFSSFLNVIKKVKNNLTSAVSYEDIISFFHNSHKSFLTFFKFLVISI